MEAKQARILVTGATGFLGGRLVKRLVAEGYRVRALARKTSRVGALQILEVEIACGDLSDQPSIAAAVQGVDVVVHAAVGTSGTAENLGTVTIQGTRNVLEACKSNRVKKLIYISSCGVYEVAGYTENQIVTENAQLERFPLRRGHYSAAKLQAEALVTDAMNRDGYPIVVLRPGTLYGPGSEVFTKMMGVSLASRIFVVFGDGDSELPIVHVDNTADAVVDCISNSAADNQVFNVVDEDLVTKRMYVERVVKPLYPRAKVIYFPMSLIVGLVWLQEKLTAILGREPYLTIYKLISSQKRVRYSTSRIKKTIGWHSKIRFDQGAEQQIREHKQAANTP